MGLMRVSLVFPRMQYKTGDPPGGIALLAAQIRKAGYTVDIIDTTFNPTHEYIESKIDSFNPDWVAIYSDSLMYNDAIKIAKYSRSKGKKILFGGPHATLRPETFVEHGDFIVKGEADVTIVEILKGDHKEQIIEGKKIGLENLPIPAYDLLDMENYMNLWHPLDSVSVNLRGTNMFTSRGCPYRCTFCQPVLDKIFGKGVRSRTVDNVIAEIKYLKENYGINAIWFNDDTFTIRKTWIKEFCQRLHDENLNILWGVNSRIDTTNEEQLRLMHAAGLRIMHVGIESGSQRVSDEIYNKDIDLSKVPELITLSEKIGVHILGYFMMGAPGETEQDIQDTIDFAQSLDATEITATIATPLPETHMYNKVKNTHQLNENYDYYKNTVFKNPTVPFKRLKFLQKKLLFKFYTHPKRWPYVANHLTSPRGVKKMVLKVKRFM
jgi:anaerobic magnesium-protoporphyrin IX monomethyl ester cyclase